MASFLRSEQTHSRFLVSQAMWSRVVTATFERESIASRSVTFVYTQSFIAPSVIQSESSNSITLIFTSPRGRSAKYCNERVCVSARLFVRSHIFQKPHVHMLPVLRC